MERVENVIHPYVYTVEGSRIPISKIDGRVGIGVMLKSSGERFEVMGEASDCAV